MMTWAGHVTSLGCQVIQFQAEGMMPVAFQFYLRLQSAQSFETLLYQIIHKVTLMGFGEKSS
jgi:hypothetical protein